MQQIFISSPFFPGGICLFRFSKETSEYCVGFVRAMKTAERRELHRSGEDIINFESMLHSVSIVNLKRVKILKREIFARYQIFPFPTCH